MSITNTPSGAAAIAFNYVMNDANQRIQTHLQDGTFWVYNYDTLGQAISGKKFWSDWTPVAGQQFEYGFDDIGNRNSTKAGGDEAGANLRSATYSANSLNQYASRTIPNAFDVIGLELATNSVNVNSATPYRHGEYFRKEITVVNSSTSVWQSVTVSAPSETSVTGNVFVAKSSETFGYDLDGNMTNDGRFTFAWDAENRLVGVQSQTNSPQASWRKVIWEFDAKGRRVRQTSSDGSSGSYVITDDLKFLADGWRHVAELNATNNALVRSYLWGLDLTGSTDGAGGIGGLILMNSAANSVHFAMYDGNGNVAGLAKASDGTVSANYEYGPFGETLRATGVEAREMPFRFSTKRTDNSTDLVLYEFRIYAPGLARWLSSDPLEEDGGRNLYGFLGNKGEGNIDLLGLEWFVARRGLPRADAYCSDEDDDWQGLASLMQFDVKDYKRWVRPADPKPEPCKIYSVPNTVFIDLGKKTPLDFGPFNIISQLRNAADANASFYEAHGFFVRKTKAPKGGDIMDHLSSKDIWAYYYFGHGDSGKINTGGFGGQEWVAPGRYTIFGIAQMGLYACESMMATGPGQGGAYVQTPWERNVSTHGALSGFVEEITGLDWMVYSWHLLSFFNGTNN